MKYDFSKIQVTDLEGKVLPSEVMVKPLANAIYKNTKDLDLVDIALQINRGEPVELEKPQVAEIKRVIDAPESGFFAFVKKAFHNFLDTEGK